MRIANLAGRACLLGRTNALDVATASDGRFGPEPASVWQSWSEFLAWARAVEVDAHPASKPYDEAALLAPVPGPSQIFAIGLNYADHATEAAMDLPENPLVFTKFPSSLAGPSSTVQLRSDTVDWEVELVVVVGAGGRDLEAAAGWEAVAGLMVGQDLSDRTVQMWGKPAQFNLGKSFAGFSPTGPAVVTVDEVGSAHDLDRLGISCRVDDGDGSPERTLQDGNTQDMIFSVPQLIARLSAIVELRSGDLIFTGTPSGVGMGHKPPTYLRAGQRLVSEIEGVGSIRQVFTS